MDPGSHRRTTFMEGVMSIKPVNLQPEDLSMEALDQPIDEATGDTSLTTGKTAAMATGATQSVTGTGTIRVNG